MLDARFPPWPAFTEAEVRAVATVLRSNRVSYWTGTETGQFETEFAAWVGVPHAVAMNNGTVALEAALRALEVGPGDEVIVSPRSFMASASCVVSVGAIPVFADVDRDTQNITADTIAAVLTPRARAIIPVHLAGMPCDMDPILDLASLRRLAVVEDCAQAHGARYRGRSVGSLGRIGAWSFCQDKIITTGGEGGMVTTADSDLWSRMWSYKDHGKNRNAAFDREHPSGFRWLHESFGTNGRMLEMQAVIGRIQLGRMTAWATTRRANAGRIWQEAETIPGLRVPPVPKWGEHAAYRAYVFVRPEALATGWDRDRIMSEISLRGIPCSVGSCPEIYREKAFDGTGWRPAKPLPVAAELGQTSLAFLVHPTLGMEHIAKTCAVLREVMALAVR